MIDWTSADIGDYREDLAWTRMLASTILAPQLGELLVSGYSTVAGREIADLDYFEVLEILRRLTDFSVNMKRNGGIVEARGESSGIKLDQRQHYRNVLGRLKTLTGLDISGIRALIG